jgi:glycosyltransferase involved in cell wall biosynthesis
MNSQVTVLIPFYNQAAYIRQALDSVFAQTYPHWQLILVDDGSTEDYLPEIQPYLADKRVRLLQKRDNAGQSKAMNDGLALVNTPYVVQLDGDDMFTSGTLDVLLAEAQKQPPSTGLICGNMLMFFQNPAGKIYKTKIRMGRPFSDRYEFLLANTTLCPRFYRTSALQDIGGWPTDDPYQGRYREDMLVLYRLIEKYSFHWINQLLYQHRRHGTNQTHQLDQYNEVAVWSIRAALKRWGDEYEPVFESVEGWVRLGRLRKK